MVAVAAALFAAGVADLDADRNEADSRGMTAGRPGKDCRCCGADVGALEIEPDAVAHVCYRILGQASVRAGTAVGCTGVEGLDRGGHRCGVFDRVGMCGEHVVHRFALSGGGNETVATRCRGHETR